MGRSAMMVMTVGIVGTSRAGAEAPGVIIVVAVVSRPPERIPRRAGTRNKRPNPPTTLGSARGRVRVPPLATFRGGAICGAPVATRGAGRRGAAESPSTANIFLDAFAGARGGLLPRANGRGQRGGTRPGGEVVGALVPVHRLVVRIHSTRRRPTHPRRRRAPPRRRKRAHAPRSVNDTSRSYRGPRGKTAGARARRSDPAESGIQDDAIALSKLAIICRRRGVPTMSFGERGSGMRGHARTRPPRGVPRRAGSLTTPDRTCCAVCSWVSCSGWR